MVRVRKQLFTERDRSKEPHPYPPFIFCRYHIHHNFCVYGGHKSDFDGHSKRSDNNLHVYSSVYGARCVGVGAQFLPVAGFQEMYINNTCILGDANDEVYGLPFQDAFPPHAQVSNASEFQARFISGGNTIYIPNATARGVGPFKTVRMHALAAAAAQTSAMSDTPRACAQTRANFIHLFSLPILQFQDFAASGYEIYPSTVTGAMPSAETIVAWGKALLEF
jgi:hypothetical protein